MPLFNTVQQEINTHWPLICHRFVSAFLISFRIFVLIDHNFQHYVVNVVDST